MTPHIISSLIWCTAMLLMVVFFFYIWLHKCTIIIAIKLKYNIGIFFFFSFFIFFSFLFFFIYFVFHAQLRGDCIDFTIVRTILSPLLAPSIFVSFRYFSPYLFCTIFIAITLNHRLRVISPRSTSKLFLFSAYSSSFFLANRLHNTNTFILYPLYPCVLCVYVYNRNNISVQ